jgi:hypothetical protein
MPVLSPWHECNDMEKNGPFYRILREKIDILPDKLVFCGEKRSLDAFLI